MKKTILLLASTFIVLVCIGCKQTKEYKAKHTFYVKNQLGGDEQKIADFYEGMTGLSDCNVLKRIWEKNGYEAYCVSR